MRAEQFLSLLKGLAEGIFTAVVFVFIPIVLLTLISSRTASLFGLQSFTVLSGSMSPLIETGSVVYTFPTTRPQVGDIITFKKGKINVTHRVVDTVNKDGKHIVPFANPLSGGVNAQIFYKTKGDANTVADKELVPSDQVIGSVIFHFPSLGKFAAFIKSIPGFLSLIVLPTIVFIGFELWNIKKELEKEIEKKTLRRFGIQ